MEVLFLRSFEKDLSKADATVRKRILVLIRRMEEAKSVLDLQQVKKLKGSKDAYRISIGQYRLGFFVAGQQFHLARLMDRREIYRFFP